MIEEQDQERFRKDYPEEYQRQIDESVARQTREHVAQRDRQAKAAAVAMSEMSLEDIFGKD